MSARDQYECPHNGRNYDMKSRGKSYTPVECGEDGWLCEMCKADRADVRAVIQGVVSNPNSTGRDVVEMTRIALELARRARES